MIRILVDFNAMTKDGKRVVIPRSTLQAVTLSPGVHIIIYEPDDFEVEAVVECEIEEKFDREWWYAVPDWSTRRELSDDVGE